MKSTHPSKRTVLILLVVWIVLSLATIVDLIGFSGEEPEILTVIVAWTGGIVTQKLIDIYHDRV